MCSPCFASSACLLARAVLGPLRGVPERSAGTAHPAARSRRRRTCTGRFRRPISEGADTGRGAGAGQRGVLPAPGLKARLPPGGAKHSRKQSSRLKASGSAPMVQELASSLQARGDGAIAHPPGPPSRPAQTMSRLTGAGRPVLGMRRLTAIWALAFLATPSQVAHALPADWPGAGPSVCGGGGRA